MSDEHGRSLPNGRNCPCCWSQVLLCGNAASAWCSLHNVVDYISIIG